MFANTYKAKRVLITGHTGFKGSWLSLWLKTLGSEVFGLSLAPLQPESLYKAFPNNLWGSECFGDICDARLVKNFTEEVDPDFVFHFAAQSLVKHSYDFPIDTLRVNALGTATILDSLRDKKSPTTVVIATSDKCYENKGWEFSYRETDQLGGADPYSTSKACAELVVDAWRRSYFRTNSRCHIATARGGNVIGGGDYAADRLIPDCVRAILSRSPVVVRFPHSIRPWQHVLDCLSGYLWLGAKLDSPIETMANMKAFNFGPSPNSNRTVHELLQHWSRCWPMEYQFGNQDESKPEAKLLTLSIERARMILNWVPTWNFDRSVSETASWYRARHLEKRANALDLCRAQIETFMADGASLSAAWASDK